MAGPDEEGFLGRWSRRKAEAKTTEPSADADPAETLDAEGTEATPVAEEPGEPPAFDPSTLPDIDSLGPGSDFSPFMQVGVPPALKTKALRKLWRVKPELANLDGLIDYGEDLTGSFKVVDHLKTAYEVGRGFLRDADDEESEDHETIEPDEAAAEIEAPEPSELADSDQADGDTHDADIDSDRRKAANKT